MKKQLISILCVLLCLFISMSTVGAAANYTVVSTATKEDMMGFATNGTQSVMVSQNSIYTSKDCLKWTKLKISLSALSKDFYPSWVGYIKGKFYIIGGGSIISSIDGNKWTVSKNTGAIEKMFLVGDKIVAYGSKDFNKVMYESKDGVAWSAAKALVVKDGSLPLNARISDIAVFKGVYYGIIGDQERGSSLFTSTDGVNWNKLQDFSNAAMYKIGTVGDSVFAYGAQCWTSLGVIASATDGKTWATTEFDKEGTNVQSIVKAGNGYVALTNSDSAVVGGGYKLMYSADSKNWKDILTDSKNSMTSIYYGKNVILGLGAKGYAVTINQNQFKAMAGIK